MPDFDNLYRLYYGFILKFLLKFTKDQIFAEELTQETFFKAYMNLNALKHIDKAPTWLCQIAKNTYFAWYKHQKRTLSLNYMDFSVTSTGENIEKNYIEKEMVSKALEQIQILGEPYREVFLLRTIGEASLKEISETFGKSESWARVTYYRAKQKILEGMSDYNEM